MIIKPFDGFKSLKTHHCYTGSMRHIYLYNQHDISEEMLLGLGGGVGFIYWRQKGAPPFMGGRMMPKPSMEEIAGKRTGVWVETYTTTSERKARSTLLEALLAGRPVMLQVDMGFLPYLQVEGQEPYHFGGHIVVACGYDPDADQVLIADRDGVHVVKMADLSAARGSTYKPFPPKNCWYTYNFDHKRSPTSQEIKKAILEQAQGMLEPPISNIGVKGIRKAASMIPKWPEILTTDEIRFALLNNFFFINALGGTGGGIFRYMFSRFLAEAAEQIGETKLLESAQTFQDIGEDWERLGDWFQQTSKAPDPATLLSECTIPLRDLAEKEELGWTHLRQIVS